MRGKSKFSYDFLTVLFKEWGFFKILLYKLLVSGIIKIPIP
jgi:hypothetical protein